MNGKLAGLLAAAALGAGFAGTASAADSLARFEGGIGSQPLRSGGTPNVVFNVPAGGLPWVISQLSADVKTDGRISVAGRGLLFAGGNAVGGTGAVTSVRARLYCDGVPYDTVEPTPLEPDGDFRVDGTLVAVPVAPCGNPVLLILNGAGTAWFAAGIPKW